MKRFVCRGLLKNVCVHLDVQNGMAFPPEEVELLRSVPPHQNVMELFDVIRSSKDVYLVQEYVDGCELFEHIVRRGALPVPECNMIFSQIVRGVSWLHLHGIAHRDLSKT